MIPETKKDAVARALREAFGVNEFDDVRPVSGGMSGAGIFRIVVAGNPYLLRIMMSNDTTPGPGRGDPTHQFACMRTAAGAGVAPRVWYTSVEDRVSITDFATAKPFPGDAAARIAATIRELHALPPFPKRVNYFEVLDGLIRRFQAAKILPETATAELFRLYGELAKVYPRDETDHVASHNDVKPENIIFDGDRVWLVDWEAAFLNDPYFDLAMVANFFVTGDAREEAFLGAYLGEAAGEYRLARFYLMRQILHMSYTMMFMLIGSGGKAIEPDTETPAFRDFHNGILAGEISLVTQEAKLQYARVHMNQLLENMCTARFHDALRIVSGRPGRVEPTRRLKCS
jgi:aminoglycoside phosphotransferase (APT) family kinase protein